MQFLCVLFLALCSIVAAKLRTSVKTPQVTKKANPSPQFDILQILDKEEHILPPWALEEVHSMATSTLTTPPPCITDESQFGYINGMLSATQTFYNCLMEVTDPLSLPNFYNGTANGNVTVYTSIQLNNLHQVDAVAGTITVDFYLRLYWQDNRFAMPLFWNRVDPKIRKYGFEITPFLNNGNTSNVGVFLPDIRFHDVTDLNYIVETIRINSSNVFFWSRHTVATFMQPKMTFHDYPADTQIFHLRYGSYAYDRTWLKMGFTQNPSAISLNQNFDGSATFLANPEWQYDAGSTSYETYLSSSGFVNAIYHIGIRRKGSGIVLRLILPITLLCFLGGLTFWADYGSRVDSTITLLLAVSALYIVILANIPLVGYLTSMDTFIFWMFLLLVFAVVLHQVYATIQDDKEQWPLRIFAGRFIEFLGRLSIFPLVTFFFLYYIGDVTESIRVGLISLTIIIGSFILVKELAELQTHYKESIKLLLQKLNSEDLLIKNLSPLELLFVNRLEFHKWSISPVYVSEFLEKVGGLDIPQSRSVPLRRYSSLKNPRHENRKVPLPYGDLSDDEEERLSKQPSQTDIESPTGKNRSNKTQRSSGNSSPDIAYKGLATKSGEGPVEIYFEESNPQRKDVDQQGTGSNSSSVASTTSNQPSPLRSSFRKNSSTEKIGNSNTNQTTSEKKTVVFSGQKSHDFGVQEHHNSNDDEDTKSKYYY